jgi:hypothetical protein
MDEQLHYQAEAAISLVAEGHCPLCKVGLLTCSQVAPFHRGVSGVWKPELVLDAWRTGSAQPLRARGN